MVYIKYPGEVLRPAPGWVLVGLVETSERYAGSPLIIPDSVRDRVARWQYECVAIPDLGGICDDDGCNRLHASEDFDRRHHQVPATLQPGSWLLAEPRGLVEVPGEARQWLLALDDVWAILG